MKHRRAKVRWRAIVLKKNEFPGGPHSNRYGFDGSSSRVTSLPATVHVRCAFGLPGKSRREALAPSTQRRVYTIVRSFAIGVKTGCRYKPLTDTSRLRMRYRASRNPMPGAPIYIPERIARHTSV